MQHHRHTLVSGSTLQSIFIFLLVIALSGCAAKKVQNKPIFFPPAPDVPHVQYLTSISSIADLNSSIFSSAPEPEQMLNKPYGIAVKGSRLYVSDPPFGRINVIDLKKKAFSPLDQEILRTPINIVFDGQSDIYVADTGIKSVIQFSGDKVIKAFPAGDMKPTDMAVSGDELFIVDNSSSEIKVFNKHTGQLMRAIGREGKPEDLLSLPTNMALDREGNIYVTNIGTCRVVKMDRSGKILKAFGELGDRPGQFTRPKGIAVDDDGLIYVVDAGSQVVQIFNQEGRVLMYFGERGSREGTLNIPADIAVSRDNLEYFESFVDSSFQLEQLLYVTNQSGPRKISVYGFGHQKETAVPPGNSAATN